MFRDQSEKFGIDSLFFGNTTGNKNATRSQIFQVSAASALKGI
ncbi:hypothetical protein Echvi_3626 [Echinicola vietnamensis DSM 17526]|uniref:Uncharacterized protein n=1 Tax=Echinicola vietnamensis (strain DSM 17526 / LMG 23754 / KMM 6221) TaxID=926556 RepID=L0G498_ECHVK|nr:hypothetical protein Echvi_3626 [Echinicola vietnamensis DSM 17526]